MPVGSAVGRLVGGGGADAGVLPGAKRSAMSDTVMSARQRRGTLTPLSRLQSHPLIGRPWIESGEVKCI